NSTRTDEYGWGIVNAYDALTQQDGPPRRRYVRLLDATSGATLKLVPVDATGAFALTQLAAGSYQLVAGEDEAGDGAIGVPGRRFAWAGAAAAPTVYTAASGSSLVQTAGITIGVPNESEPNDDTTSANPLSVGGYVVGQINPPDTVDYYRVLIPAAGTYTFETSGVMGACGWGLELDTDLQLFGAGQTVASNDNSGATTGPFCSRITSALSPGTYYVAVTGSAGNGLADHGRYRLQVRAGN
ncbi:MAG: PPC domain-containing protein, partial [Gemmatimonadota bacterium]|nr:PPC domain-containing protein [Gemmatimonadota bacterium]